MSTIKLKVIQVNIYKGRYLDSLVDFLRRENPDFVTMQEVTTGGFSLYEGKDADVFDLLSKRLKMFGVFHGDLKLKGDDASIFGNAVFSKHEIVSNNILTLKTFRPVTNEELNGVSGEVREQIDRHLLDVNVNLDGCNIHVMSWHGAWTAPPQDTSETERQAELVYKHIKKIDTPFILGGDLNAVIGSKTVDLISSVSNNLMLKCRVSMTTNPAVHKIAPQGFLIDYLFTSREFRLKSINVPQITISDHLPVLAELEVDL